MPALTARKYRAIDLLLAGMTQAETARELKVPRSTVNAWMKSVDFAAELTARRKERRRKVSALIDAAAVQAIETLRALMLDEEQPGAVRARAAGEILDRAGIEPIPLDEGEAAGAKFKTPEEMIARMAAEIPVHYLEQAARLARAERFVDGAHETDSDEAQP